MEQNPWTDKIILVVEDEPMTYKLIEIMLNKTGVTLLKAGDGKEAIKVCKSRRDIDLILMDIGLPELDGFQATKKIRKIRPQVPIIAQTAYVMKSQQQMCFDVGCNGYLSKPYSSDDLKSLISNFFDN